MRVGQWLPLANNTKLFLPLALICKQYVTIKSKKELSLLGDFFPTILGLTGNIVFKPIIKNVVMSLAGKELVGYLDGDSNDCKQSQNQHPNTQ